MNSPKPETDPDLISLFVRPIHDAGMRYLIGGSLAAMQYSEPRYTIDVDIPLLIRSDEVKQFSLLFPEPDFYCPPEEVIREEVERGSSGQFNIIHITSGLKADFYASNRNPIFAWAFQNRRIEETPSGPANIAPPEYVILWKLIFYREGGSDKHLRDIYAMLAVQGDRIDRSTLEKFVTEQSLEATWKKALEFAA